MCLQSNGHCTVVKRGAIHTKVPRAEERLSSALPSLQEPSPEPLETRWTELHLESRLTQPIFKTIKFQWSIAWTAGITSGNRPESGLLEVFQQAQALPWCLFCRVPVIHGLGNYRFAFPFSFEMIQSYLLFTVVTIIFCTATASVHVVVLQKVLLMQWNGGSGGPSLSDSSFAYA